MSIRVMSAVWEKSRAKSGDLIVLLAIADFAHDNGIAFPSVATLAAKARLTDRHVKRILQRLVQIGELSIDPNKGISGTNRYRVLIQDSDRLSLGSDAEVPDGVTPTSSEPSGTVRKSSGDISPRWSREERSAMWDALEEVTGIVPESIGERSRFGKMVNELLSLRASPEEVKSRARRWPMRYPGATLTDTALVGRWGELSGRKPKGAATWRCDVESCGLTFPSEQKKLDHMRNVHDAA